MIDIVRTVSLSVINPLWFQGKLWLIEIEIIKDIKIYVFLRNLKNYLITNIIILLFCSKNFVINSFSSRKDRTNI